jgi:hypothetical protein
MSLPVRCERKRTNLTKKNRYLHTVIQEVLTPIFWVYST